jgi:hypothetical protein
MEAYAIHQSHRSPGGCIRFISCTWRKSMCGSRTNGHQTYPGMRDLHAFIIFCLCDNDGTSARDQAKVFVVPSNGILNWMYREFETHTEIISASSRHKGGNAKPATSSTTYNDDLSQLAHAMKISDARSEECKTTLQPANADGRSQWRKQIGYKHILRIHIQIFFFLKSNSWIEFV